MLPPSKLSSDWMSSNPQRWPGKKILCRKTGMTYTIHEVLNARNVVLEMKWILFVSNVRKIRRDYEPAEP